MGQRTNPTGLSLSEMLGQTFSQKLAEKQAKVVKKVTAQKGDKDLLNLLQEPKKTKPRASRYLKGGKLEIQIFMEDKSSFTKELPVEKVISKDLYPLLTTLKESIPGKIEYVKYQLYDSAGHRKDNKNVTGYMKKLFGSGDKMKVIF
jgi:hypothetical protein